MSRSAAPPPHDSRAAREHGVGRVPGQHLAAVEHRFPVVERVAGADLGLLDRLHVRRAVDRPRAARRPRAGSRSSRPRRRRRGSRCRRSRGTPCRAAPRQSSGCPPWPRRRGRARRGAAASGRCTGQPATAAWSSASWPSSDTTTVSRSSGQSCSQYRDHGAQHHRHGLAARGDDHRDVRLATRGERPAVGTRAVPGVRHRQQQRTPRETRWPPANGHATHGASWLSLAIIHGTYSRWSPPAAARPRGTRR